MNAIEMALKLEQEAVEFYTQCAGKTNNPVGKKMFLSIAEDEKYHIACAMNVQQGKAFTPAESPPIEEMKKIFDQHKEEMLRQVASTADELDAFRVAMKMEEESITFYRKAAVQAANPEERAFFDCLIKDEEEHFRIFQDTLSFLEDPANWSMWEQKGIVEG